MQSKRTGSRFVVLFFLCTLALVLYIDRVCIGQAQTAIRAELRLSKEQFSWVLSAFTLSYALFEVPAGHWGDRYGSRGVIARIVVWWSIFTGLTGAVFGYWQLVAVRFLFGAGEAGAFPNAARVVTKWFPPQERGVARGMITTTSMLGGAISPPLAAFFIGKIGWRLTFVVFGAIGIVWTAAFYWWFRDDPNDHPATNEAERRHITPPPDTGAAAETHAPIPWSLVVTSPNVWLLGTIMTFGATLFYMLFQWFPTYLKEAHGATEQTAGALSGVVLSGGAFGCIAGGIVSDLLIRFTTERRWSRRFLSGGCFLLSAASLGSVHLCHSVLLLSLANACALFFLQLSIPTWWTVVAEISGRHGAAMFGLMNSMGAAGVFVSTMLIGYVVEARERAGLPKIQCWEPVFDGVAVAMIVGAVCWFFVDATRSIVERPHSR